MATLELKELRKSYGDTEVVHGVNLLIESGEFCVFVGPSGCGKSTMLRMIAGLEDITSGDVKIAGDLVSNVPAAQRGLAMVFQSYALYPHMSVKQNLSFGLENMRMAREEIERRVAEAARMLQIEELMQRKPGQLSGGQRQRVAIGRTVVREPKVFLFDEPLSNLDAELRVAMRGEIAALHKRLGNTMVYVTHDQVEAMTMADKIIVLQSGAIEQVGTPLELYNIPQNLFVAGFIGSPKMNLFTGKEAENQGAYTLGIRPEHIDIVSSGGLWKGKVGVAEHLGSDTFIHVHETGLAKVVTVRASGEVDLKYGDQISLSPRSDLFHKFDPKGIRLT